MFFINIVSLFSDFISFKPVLDAKFNVQYPVCSSKHLVEIFVSNVIKYEYLKFVL